MLTVLQSDSSDLKGIFSLYAFIINNKILSYLYCIVISSSGQCNRNQEQLKTDVSIQYDVILGSLVLMHFSSIRILSTKGPSTTEISVRAY